MRIRPVKAVVRLRLGLREFQDRDLHAHDALAARRKGNIYGHTACKVAAEPQGDICKPQRSISLLVNVADLRLDRARFVHKLHHLTHQNAAFAIHQLIAHARELQRLLGSH